ncbi:RNA-directed DNA polymerase, eukaryota [Tanacetum coccineum]
MAPGFRSNVDSTRVISKSIFVTNFPNNITAKDLWNLCQGYGTVVDVFIPNRLSKAGKRFAFVRFIRVDNLDRLVGNICTLWIGRMHLQANVVRYERSSAPPSKPFGPPKSAGTTSFASVLKGNPKPSVYTSPVPALVLDDSCVVARNLDLFVMGEVKQLSVINNLRVLLSNEGFPNVKLAYLGGLWVMIELESAKAKAKFMQHVGVASWFLRLCNAQPDFVARERIVWVDIEGVPLHAWTHSTFNKIGSKWGEVMELEECKDDLFGRKRICIKTKQEDNILEKFKIIVQRKVYVIRAKELFTWVPVFKEAKDIVYCTDEESIKGDDELNEKGSKIENSDDGSDIEAVSDTFFGEPNDNQVDEQVQNHHPNDKEASYDPFNIYGLLKKRNGDAISSYSSIPFPPGFTPDIEKDTNLNNKQEELGTNSEKSKKQPDGFCSRVVEDAQQVDDHSSPKPISSGKIGRTGGSILDLLDDMIKVGSTMGYSLEGCAKDLEKIISLQGVNDGLQ